MTSSAIFFQSTHRCGTKGLASYFNECYPELYAIHQPKGARLINVMTTLYLYGWVSETFMRNLARKKRVNWIKCLNHPAYIETNGFNLVLGKFIEEEVKNTKFVHIIRDPKSWILSYMNWVNSRFKSKVAYRFVPFWNINPVYLGKISKKGWNKLQEYEKFCWWWKLKNEMILTEYSSSDNFKSFRFEDLFLYKDHLKWKELTEFCGLEFHPDSIEYFDVKRNTSKDKVYELNQFWSEDKVKKIKAIAGDLMNKYNYG